MVYYQHQHEQRSPHSMGRLASTGDPLATAGKANKQDLTSQAPQPCKQLFIGKQPLGQL